MMEQEQFEPWLTGCDRRTSRTPLQAYEKIPIWTVGPEAHAVPRLR